MAVPQFVAEAREPPRPWRRLWRRLRPIDRGFFPLFEAQAGLAVEALLALVHLLRDVRDPDGRVREIEAIEKRADGVVDQVQASLRQALFPPFARVAVHDLAIRLDDVIDLTEDAAQSLHLYHLLAVPPEALRLAELALAAMRKLQDAVGRLRRLDEPAAVLALCAEVDELEAQADHVLRASMSRLFREEPDARQIVKLKAVYEVLESLTDMCKDVASELQAIVLKHG
jgi:predicted phosphate transport protein (TIGR00153 family)